MAQQRCQLGMEAFACTQQCMCSCSMHAQVKHTFSPQMLPSTPLTASPKPLKALMHAFARGSGVDAKRSCAHPAQGLALGVTQIPTQYARTCRKTYTSVLLVLLRCFLHCITNEEYCWSWDVNAAHLSPFLRSFFTALHGIVLSSQRVDCMPIFH